MNSVPIVHYVRNSSGGPDYPQLCRAAIVTSEFSELTHRPVDLAVFDPEGIRFKRNAGYDSADHVPGTWHRLSDHEPAEQLRETESSSEQLEDLALAIVVNAWNHATELSVLQNKICELVGVARDSAPRNVLPG